MNNDYIVIRKLTDSDFGLFAEPRDRGKVKSKQRAININADIISRLLPSNLIDEGEVYLAAKCLRSECQDERTRILSKVGKNWRLGGKKIPGKVFLKLKTGDLFLCRLSAAGEPPFPMVWTVLFQDGDTENYKAACEAISDHLVNRMAVFPSVDSRVSLLKHPLPSPPGHKATSCRCWRRLRAPCAICSVRRTYFTPSPLTIRASGKLLPGVQLRSLMGGRPI